MGNVREALKKNERLSRTKSFVDRMVCEIKRHGRCVVRVHVAGDFYSEDYVHKWKEIATKCPRAVFFAYTRSWRSMEMLPALIELSRLSNVRLWWSMDLVTGPAPYISGVRRAYMAISDEDASQIPVDCDLVFRVNHKSAMKKANGVLVCPYENGIVGKHTHSCSTCQVCFRDNEPRWLKLTGKPIRLPSSSVRRATRRAAKPRRPTARL